MSFGNIEMYVPKTWQVIDNIHTTLGNVKNDREWPTEPNAPRLTLHGNVEFGNIEIVYI